VRNKSAITFFLLLVLLLPTALGFQADQVRQIGNKVLFDLGLDCPLPDEDSKTRWDKGLLDITQQMIQDQVDDQEEMARRLISFRRDFLGDKSRILNLGDIKM